MLGLSLVAKNTGKTSGLSGLAQDKPVPKNESAEDLSERHADLIRGQWDDWLTNGKPYEDMQFSYFTDPEKRQQLRGNAMNYVRNSTDQAYTSGLASMTRRDERYGVQLTPDEMASRNRKMQARKQATKAKGLSDMTSYLDNRELHMLSGGLSGMSQVNKT
jgi:hypothetical protein